MSKVDKNNVNNALNAEMPTVLDYAKEKLAITEKLIEEDNGLDDNHSSFLNGLLNAYDDIVFALENETVKHCRELQQRDE